MLSTIHDTSEWTLSLATFETFDQSDEETWLDQKIYLPTYLPTSFSSSSSSPQKNAFNIHFLQINRKILKRRAHFGPVYALQRNPCFPKVIKAICIIKDEDIDCDDGWKW